MTIVTTYTCDKCGNMQEDDPLGMWQLEIKVGERTKSNYTSRMQPVKVGLWCRSCVVKIGLLPPTKDDPPAPTPPPTFEDMIREIIQEEIEASQ